MNDKPRKFTSVTGFLDNTEYLEAFGPYNVWLVRRDGTRMQCHGFNLDDCLRFVRDGVWREIE